MKSPENKPPRGMTLEATFGDGKRPTPASRSGGRNGDQESSRLSEYFARPGQIFLLLAVVISPWFFASVNFGAQRWIAISLLVGLGFWWFEASMNSRNKQVLPLLFFPLGLGILLGLFQLVPLPEFASSLLGRQVEIQQQIAGSDATSFSISVDPDGTWDHLRLLTIALAAVLLGSRYFRSKQDITILLTVMAANGCAISFFGIIHKFTTDPSNPLMFWYHKVALGGAHFGPFVNRNNACGYLLICMAAAIGLLPILLTETEPNGPRIPNKGAPIWRQMLNHMVEFFANLNAKKVSILMAIVLIGVGIVISLSRGGISAMLFGGVVSLFAYGMARQPKNSMFVFIPVLILFGLLIGFWTVGDELTQRLFEQTDTVNIDSDLRITQWKSTWPATKEFGLFGSGLGTYRGVHRSYSQIPEIVVFYFAENQYFQALVEAGWIGLLIYLSAWVLAYKSAYLLLGRGQSPTSIAVGLMGAFLISSQAVASLLDFGFYIPANTLGLSVMLGFLGYHAQALGGRLKKGSWIRLRVPNMAISTIALVLFVATSLVAYGLHQRASIQNLSRPRIKQLTRDDMTLDQSTERLNQLLPLVSNCSTPEGLNYAAGLFVHRCRLQLFDDEYDENDIERLVAVKSDAAEKAKEKAAITENLWNVTQLMRQQENVNFLKSNSKMELRRFLAKPFIQQNLHPAKELLERSRKISPLQPWVHLRLAQINSILGDTEYSDRCIERIIAITPKSPKYRNRAGIYYLQSNRPKLAAEQFRRELEMQPHRFNKVMAITTGRTNRAAEPISAEIIGSTMLPDEPSLLFKYATQFRIANPEQKRNTLERAAIILDDLGVRRTDEQNKLLGDIRRLQEEPEKAVEAYNDYLLIFPHDLVYLNRRSLLLEQLGKHKLALEDVNRIIDRTPDPEKYRIRARELRLKLSEQ